MAAQISDFLPSSIQKCIKESKILVIGAGGIGCELLKNLVLSGFHDIEVIDLDTIDVSNLNRQFLFHKQHVGRSKSQVARESALKFCPQAKIVAYHDNVMSTDYGVSFYQKFSLVMNALDNRAARNHVNRMCLAANITLVESGTAGYLGQVTVIRKGETECYECQPKAAAKTYPGCTIRNTPSEPIHCIVWSKHLFNQLFGEGDPDEDVSPDSADPELQNQTTEASGDSSATNGNGVSNNTSDALPQANEAGNVERQSTRAWAQSHNYDPKKLFTKLFGEDIKYLLSMDKLWTKRRPPTPLEWDHVMQQEPNQKASTEGTIKDQVLWTLPECLRVFGESTEKLREQFQKLKPGDHLVWDKDEDPAMDFVTACANIRANVFAIQQKTRFDVKSMAGNIIPAIATTNAMIAGLLVMEAIKVLDGRPQDCRSVFLNRRPNPRGRVLVPCRLEKPVPTCYVCSAKNEVNVLLNIQTTTLAALNDKILKATFNMVAPDVEVADGKGTILISSDPDDIDDPATYFSKTLQQMGVNDGTRLNCDDFLQNYTLALNLIHSDSLEEGLEFKVVADAEQLRKIQDSAEAEDEKPKDDEEDDIEMVAVEAGSSAVKRKPSDAESEQPTKKQKLDEDIICV